MLNITNLSLVLDKSLIGCTVPVRWQNLDSNTYLGTSQLDHNQLTE